MDIKILNVKETLHVESVENITTTKIAKTISKLAVIVNFSMQHIKQIQRLAKVPLTA